MSCRDPNQPSRIQEASLFLSAGSSKLLFSVSGRNLKATAYTIILENNELKPYGPRVPKRLQLFEEDQRGWPRSTRDRSCSRDHAYNRLGRRNPWRANERPNSHSRRQCCLCDQLCILLEKHADWEICGEAADEIEAIEKYRELRPDLLVVGVSMPRMNGLRGIPSNLCYKGFSKTSPILGV